MGWFSNSDNKDDENKFNEDPKSFQKSFSSNANSIMKVCRMDPKDNTHMICKIRETKTQNINGKDEAKTEEREERIPVNFPQIDPFDLATRENIKSITSDFVDDVFSFGSEMKAMEEHFRRTFNTFFGNNFFFNDFFKEMDGTMSHFANNFDSGYPKPTGNYDTYQQSNLTGSEPGPSRAYPPNYNYKFNRGQKSDKDIYDV